MSKVVLLLSAVSLALLASLVMRSRRAGAQLESAQKETLSVSNQLSEAQIKVNHQERMNAALQNQLAERETSVAGLSNSVAQVRVTLATTRAELGAVRAEIPPAIARGNAFAAERDGFSNRVNEVEAALSAEQRLVSEARARALALQSELAALSHRLADEQAGRRRLENQLADPVPLQMHLAEARRQMAVKRTSKVPGNPDYHQPLQLQTDGTVVLTSAPRSSGN